MLYYSTGDRERRLTGRPDGMFVDSDRGGVVAFAVKGTCVPAYLVCLWTSHEAHRGVLHPKQFSIERVIPVVLHWHWASLAFALNLVFSRPTQIHTQTTTFFFFGFDYNLLTVSNQNWFPRLGNALP
jgi:hypothetical protein